MIYWISASAALLAIAFAAFYCGLSTTRYNVGAVVRGCPEHTLRVVLLSDLHSTGFGRDQSKLLEAVRVAMPDLIVMSGDMIDDRRDSLPADQLIEGLTGLGIPVFFSPGNHEYYNSNRDAVLDGLRKRGVKVLTGDFQRLALGGVPVAVAGISDPTFYESLADWESDLGRLGDGLPRDSLKLLISHRPEKLDYYAAAGFDIVFCGHAHGGQVRLPFLPWFKNGLYAPHQGFLPRYTGGVYSKDGTVMIVSRGLSRFLRLPRVFNPPEVVTAVVEINPQTAGEVSDSSPANIPHRS